MDYQTNHIRYIGRNGKIDNISLSCLIGTLFGCCYSSFYISILSFAIRFPFLSSLSQFESPQFKEEYLQYVTNYNISKETLDRCIESFHPLKEFLEGAHRNPRYYDSYYLRI